MLKPRLIILSDLWGKEKGDWFQKYVEALEDNFKLNFYDSRELAQIPLEGLSEDEIHHQFVKGGIDFAVDKLLQIEKKPVTILAFSIGGTIAWKAAMKGLNVRKIVAVSSTRLRKEHQKPKCELEILFGDQDINRPIDEWFEEMEINPTILRNKTHELYKENSVAEYICNELITNIYF